MPSSGNTTRSDACARRLVAAALAAAVPAWGAEMPDAQRGRLLYENHCVVCHTSKVHRRIPPLPLDLGELRLIVAAWAKGQDLRWSDTEISDVVEYLDSSYYRMLQR
jgi:mono/diheme cytochrome c family protein